MLNFLGFSIAATFGVIGALGSVYATRALRLFKGDIMEQLFRLMVLGFILITVASIGDAAVLLADLALPAGVFSAALIASVAFVVIGLIRLIDWSEQSKFPLV